MASEHKSPNDLYDGQWPSDPKSYQWKGTLSIHNGTSNVLAHCKPRKQDVFVKIKQFADNDSDIDQFTENTKNLINIQHQNLLTPVHAFINKSEIWVVYPRHSGGPLIEVLTSHYPNGIPEESIVSRILYDISLGLHNLHKQQQCHRNIRASSIHIDIDNGKGLLTEFGELKEIKWKHAAGRRNTFISPEREPFTDPLILFQDDKASWYAGDIYALGITALQLTYGNTPPLNTRNILQKQSISISTDLYDKKCPFSKSFELLIKDCCASKLKDRISINKLLEHKFFTKKAEHINIKTYFGHILKSTEKRINSSLTAPISFNYNGITKSPNGNLNDENIDESNNNIINNKQQQIIMKNGMKIAVEPNGNHTLIESNNSNNNNNNNNNNKSENEPVPLSNEWSFSTTIQPEDLKNGNTPIVQPDTPVQNSHLGPTLHNQMTTTTYSNDPTQGHTDVIPAKKSRQYRVSFSGSESISTSTGMDGQNNSTVPPDNNNANTVQINRFKVEFGSVSRYSESGTVPTQIEPSETNDEPYDVSEYPHDSDEDNNNGITNPNMSNANSTCSDNANNNNTIKIKRFHITPAKNDHSADECDENNTPQPPPPKQEIKQQKPQQQRVQLEEVYSIPNKSKTKWSKSELSEWVGSFGNAFKPYVQEFIDNGIDGSFMDEIDDNELKEIVPSGLHRKRIFTAWKKLLQ